MLTVKVPLNLAQKVKSFLLAKNLFNKKYSLCRDSKYIFFPILKRSNLKTAFPDVTFTDKILPEMPSSMSLREALKEVLTKSELSHLKASFDTVGSVAILEIDDEITKKQKIIAETLLNLNPSIHTVLKKSGIHHGRFRTQDLIYLAGKKTKETEYKENNVKLLLDVEKVYFSPRLSAERKRIYQLVKPGENVLVMFSGCGPYPIVISKNTEALLIIGIEINPIAHKYGLKNILLNKLKNVKLYNADVKELLPKLSQKFDRILMPLPKSAEEFLPTALAAAKKGTIIHFYDFLDEKEFSIAEQKAKKACKIAGFKYKKLNLVKCGQHAPHIYRICLDFIVM